MKKDKKGNVLKFETPETPRAKPKDKDFSSIKEYMDKAKKYDDLIRMIKADKAICEIALDSLKEKESFLRIGYLNGYNDGKRAGYEYIVDCLLTKYLGEEDKK